MLSGRVSGNGGMWCAGMVLMGHTRNQERTQKKAYTHGEESCHESLITHPLPVMHFPGSPGWSRTISPASIESIQLRDAVASGKDSGAEFENVEITEEGAADTPKEGSGREEAGGPRAEEQGEGSGSSGRANVSPEEQALKELAATAEKVAGGVVSAVRGAEVAAKSLFTDVVESNETISKIAGGISSWWSSLDPISEPDQAPVPHESASMIAEKVQEMYGLSESDTLLEQFPCDLSQTYKTVDNECTPVIQVTFPVTLSITELNFCFCAIHKKQKHISVIPHARIKSVDKGKKEGMNTLEVLLNDGPKITFNTFSSDTALESALALLEHLASSDR